MARAAMTPAPTSWLDLPGRPGRPGLLAGAAAAILGGLLWVLASPPIGVWPLAWLAPLPTLWAIDRAPTARRAGLWGALTALVFTLGGFPWLVDLFTRFAGLSTPIAWFGLLVLGVVHGVVFLLGARLVRGLRDQRRGDPRGPWPLALCGALGAFVVEVLGWTPFPFSLGGIALHDVAPVRALTAALGPAGITALVFAIAGAVLDAMERRGRSRLIPAAAVAGYAVLLALASLRGAGGRTRTIQVGVVQPNRANDAPDSMRLRLEHLRGLQRATAELEQRGADLVVWSEAAYPFNLPRDLAQDLDENRSARLRRGFTIPVVVGAITSGSPGPHWNSALMLAADGRFTGRHDKVHRMIGSEYNPVLEWFPSARRFMPEGAGAYAGGDRAVLLEAVVDGAPLRIAALVCLEDVMPGFGRELAALQPDLVVNLTNDSWFGNDEPLQHEALARYRAIEIGVPLVRAVNTGPSSVIDPDGNFLARTTVVEGGEPTTLLVDLPVGPRRTSFYSGWGGPLGWIVAIGAIAWWLVPAIVARVRRRGRR